ncbi:MAG: FluC/FEX family fluoride channel [Candidatus Nanopelagicales bacterium]
MDPDARLPVDPDLPESPGERRWDVALVVAAGGAIGGGLRYWLNHLLPGSAVGFPWATFAENVSGSFVLALLMVHFLEVWPPHRYARPFLCVGVLGGYTTFSTYTADGRVMLAHGQPSAAILYLFGSLLAAVAAALAGLRLGRHVIRREVRA